MKIRPGVWVFVLLSALTAGQTQARAPEAPAAGPAQDADTLDTGNLEQECASGNAEACAQVGYYHDLGAYGRREDAAMAILFFQRACDIGPPDGCSGLASMYRRGKGVPVDVPRAFALYSKTCDEGERSGCFGVLSMQGEGLVAAADPANNLRLVEQVCRPDQNSWLCLESRKLSTKIQLPPAVYHAQQCDAGEEYACLTLGLAYVAGDGVPADMAQAAVAYGKGCDLGLAIACNTLGLYHAKGTGVTQDFARAAQLFQLACNEKSVAGCVNLGALYFNGTGVPQDYGRAAELHQKACDGGAGGCDYMERARIAIMGTPEQRKAEADALERQYKREDADRREQAFAVNMGDLANHFEREAQTRANADAMLARIGSQSAGDGAYAAVPQPAAATTAGTTPPPGGGAGAGGSLGQAPPIRTADQLA